MQRTVGVLLSRGVARFHLGVSRRSGPFLIAAALTAAASTAQAGPVEVLTAVRLDPSDANRMFVSYSNGGSAAGLLYSTDGAKSFSMLCTAAVGEAGLAGATGISSDTAASVRSDISRARTMLITKDGTTLVGSGSGVFQDDKNACGWELVPELAGFWAAGVAVDPTDTTSYVITNGQSQTANEGLWKRNGDGSWTQLASAQVPTNGERWTNSNLLVAAHSGGVRFYTISVRSGGDLSNIEIDIQSTDNPAGGWIPNKLTVPEQANIILLAVDPTDPDRLLAAFQRSDDNDSWDLEHDTILLSTDAGKTFTPYLDVTEVGDVLFEPDGTLWIGDAGKTTSNSLPYGLYRAAPGLAAKPQLISKARMVTCLGKRPGSDTLFLCTGSQFGSYDPQKDTFDVLMERTSVQRMQSCPGRDVVADCHDQLCTAWCGPTHFCTAPACGVYHEQLCGNHADDYLYPGTGGSDAGTDGGAPGDAGAGPSGGDGDSGHPEPGKGSDAGTAADVPAHKKSGGCALEGAPARDDLSPAWFGLMALAWSARRGRLARARARALRRSNAEE